MARNLLNVMS
ncbi:hypothetical protein HaLaN_03289, partial [Haematococcus lacustris]